MTPAVELAAAWAAAGRAHPDLWARALIGGSLLMVISAAGGQRYFAGRPAFIALMGAMLLWVINTSLERSSTDPVCKSSLALGNWIVLPLVPMLWSLFIHQYVHSDPAPPSRRWWLVSGAVWLAMVAVVLSNGQHGLLYGPGSGVVPIDDGAWRMHYERGPIYWLVAVWAYALILRSSLLVLRAWRSGPASNRRQWLGFLVVSLVPLAANVVYLTTRWRIHGSDPTPLSFSVAGLGLTWLIHRHRLFDVVPMARQLLFTELPDPVLILDGEQRVVEANAAALQLAVERPALGVALAQWPRIGAALSARLADAERQAPLQLSAPEAFFDVQVRELGQGRQRIGLLVQLHDVTAREHERRQVQQHLAQRDAEHSVLREQALRDPLTGLWNRRALDERFAAERSNPRCRPASRWPWCCWTWTTSSASMTATAMRWATRCCATWAAELRAAVRNADAVFRIGGEEFALLLAGADALQALRRTTGLRDRIAGAASAGWTSPSPSRPAWWPRPTTASTWAPCWPRPTRRCTRPRRRAATAACWRRRRRSKPRLGRGRLSGQQPHLDAARLAVVAVAGGRFGLAQRDARGVQAGGLQRGAHGLGALLGQFGVLGRVASGVVEARQHQLAARCAFGRGLDGGNGHASVIRQRGLAEREVQRAGHVTHQRAFEHRFEVGRRGLGRGCRGTGHRNRRRLVLVQLLQRQAAHQPEQQEHHHAQRGHHADSGAIIQFIQHRFLQVRILIAQPYAGLRGWPSSGMLPSAPPSRPAPV